MELYTLALKVLGWLSFVVIVAVVIDLWAYHNDSDQMDEIFDEEPR